MIKSLTSLRGIFILFIFLHHCGVYDGGGSMAVSFFFILGGFGMTLGYCERLKRPGWSYRTYIAKRAAKFYPLHWLCLLVSFPLALRSFGLKQMGLIGMNAALLQSFVPISGVYFSFNAVSWYLSDTMFFALLFPVLCRTLMESGKWGRTTIAAVMAAAYVVVAVLIPAEMHHAILYISPAVRLADFVFGMYLALAYMALKELPESRRAGSGVLQVISLLLIVSLVVESCLLTEDARLFAPLYWPLAGMLLLTASLSSEYNRGGRNWLENKHLLWLGRRSFVIYMVHQLVMRYETAVLTKILHLSDVNDAAYILITLLLTIVSSVVVERHILEPVTQCLTKRIQASMTARS